LFARDVADGGDVSMAWEAHRQRMKTAPLHAHAAMLITLEATKDYLDARLDTGDASTVEVDLLTEVCGALLIAGEA
jgi:hypothetical protein